MIRFIPVLMLPNPGLIMITVRNKYDGKIIAQLEENSIESAHVILENSKKSFQAIQGMSAYERQESLLEASARLSRLSEDFARTIAMESGKPIKYSRKEAKRAAFTLKISAEEATRLGGEVVPLDVEPRGKGRFSYYVRKPMGPVFSITPFNDPLNLVAHKVGPALGSANSIVNKPTTLAPLSSLKLAEAISDTGFPEHSFQNIISGGNSEATKFFLHSPDIRKITFTGGYEAATKLVSEAGPRPYSMELGSNSPVLVFKDSAWEERIGDMVDAAFESQGQNCIHAQRFLIDDAIYDSFTDIFLKTASRLVVGNPLDESTDIGPMISVGEAQRVIKWIEEAIDSGAQMLMGGKIEGSIVHPTVLENVDRSSKIRSQEVFGPATVFIRFSTPEEAFRIANEVPYGLQAGVFTDDLNLAMKAIDVLDYGTVLINDTSDFRIDSMPFGGTKKSGIGREGIRFAMESMTELRLAIFRK